MLHNQRVVLAVERRLFRQRLLEQPLPVAVGIAARPNAETRERPPRVSVDDEERLPRRVEEDRVRGLLADAVRGEEGRPQFVARRRQQAIEVACEGLGQQIQKGPQLARLALVEAAGPDQLRQLAVRERPHRRR